MEEPSFDDADIAVVKLATGERKILVKQGTDAHYVGSGHLVFMGAGVLMAAPFDVDKLEIKGAPVPVVEKVLENPRIGAGQYATSKDGLLAYIPGGVTYGEHEMVFVDKTRNTKPLTSNKRPYEDFTISPDGKYLAITIEGPVTNTWIHDTRGIRKRGLTSESKIAIPRGLQTGSVLLTADTKTASTRCSGSR